MIINYKKNLYIESRFWVGILHSKLLKYRTCQGVGVGSVTGKPLLWFSHNFPFSKHLATLAAFSTKYHINWIVNECYLRRLSLMKKEWFRASLAVSLSEGSYLSNPCKRCMRSPAEWSTCCIIRFCLTKITKKSQ